jgi:hypothetical protein
LRIIGQVFVVVVVAIVAIDVVVVVVIIAVIVVVVVVVQKWQFALFQDIFEYGLSLMRPLLVFLGLESMFHGRSFQNVLNAILQQPIRPFQLPMMRLGFGQLQQGGFETGLFDLQNVLRVLPLLLQGGTFLPQIFLILEEFVFRPELLELLALLFALRFDRRCRIPEGIRV